MWLKTLSSIPLCCSTTLVPPSTDSNDTSTSIDPKVSETLVFLHTQELAVVIEGVHVVEVIWFAGGDEFVFWSLRAALLDIETLQPCRCRPRTEDPIHRCIVEEGELESSPVVLSGAHATATRPGLYSIRRRKRSPMS